MYSWKTAKNLVCKLKKGAKCRLTLHKQRVNISCITQRASGGPITILFSPSGLPGIDPALAHLRRKKNKTEAVTLQSTLGDSTSTSGSSGSCTTLFFRLRVVDYCGDWAGGTEFPLGVEEEHRPGVGCMMKRVTQAPTGEDNCLGEGERGGVREGSSVTSTQRVHTRVMGAWVYL